MDEESVVCCHNILSTCCWSSVVSFKHCAPVEFVVLQLRSPTANLCPIDIINFVVCTSCYVHCVDIQGSTWFSLTQAFEFFVVVVIFYHFSHFLVSFVPATSCSKVLHVMHLLQTEINRTNKKRFYFRNKFNKMRQCFNIDFKSKCLFSF